MGKQKKDKISPFHKKAEEELKRRQSIDSDSYSSSSSSSSSETDMLRLLHELQVHQIELEMQNEELIVAKEKAEIAVKAKQQFLSNMSHEIRTPMNAIIGFTNVLLKTNLLDKQKEFLQAIKLSGETLTVLINDILDLAKVNAGKMTFAKKAFKMDASISAILYLFETKIIESNIELVIEYDHKIPKVLVGDSVRLHQIVLNLVSNAVKFTEEGKITVSVQLMQENEKEVSIQFKVIDTGIGIQEDKLTNLFEIFQQADNGTSRLYGGTGLGLAIVKQLVESQGGSVSVNSKIGEGSTFSFILSFQKTTIDAEIEIEKKVVASALKNIKVLLVEDIVLNQLLMKTLLDDFGFEYDIASNGKIAIEKLQKNMYDIILMDLLMPEMNGFEATEFIRNTMHSKIPIIALTADVTTVDLTKCKAVGMDDYLSKPVDEKELYDKICNLLTNIKTTEYNPADLHANSQSSTLKHVNLEYLTHRTKSDPKLMLEMISLYLEQTPPLISAMNQGLKNKDWNLLQSAVHKMIPSFSIMGIGKDFEKIAKRVQEDANNIQRQANEMPALVLQLENICIQACKELEDEFNRIKNA